MAVHIRDPETDALVRRYAERRGVGLTEAIKLAMTDALVKSEPTVHDKLERIRARLRPTRHSPNDALSEQDFIGSLYDIG